jgi:eukaryotic-like serine/threonine-protein kinase
MRMIVPNERASAAPDAIQDGIELNSPTVSQELSPEDFHEIETWVERALELPGPERARFLVEGLGATPERLLQVLDLLLATVEADFLETSQLRPRPISNEAFSSSLPVAADDPLGLPGFRVLETLGEGGMGTVYLAEQLAPVKRKVALKVARARLGAEARARLAAERQAMARLDHPNIAHILEAGTTPDGRPFFAMEWIEGGPITTACDHRRLDLGARLELFLKVCDGVKHAHQRGILHRDLKPSNILVDERDGRLIPKIIDFGIAKALDQPLLADVTTLTGGHMIGTPAYMSPEALAQSPGSAVSGVDTRADIFSLGILLAELLVGEGQRSRRPTESPLEYLSRIAGEDLTSPLKHWRSLEKTARQERALRRGMEPTALARHLTGDLEWIVLKAVAREPEARYGTVGELAEDLERHQRFEPIRAGRPTTLYKLRKLVRRHRASVAVTALLLTSLSFGLVARSREATRANREAEEAKAARDDNNRMFKFLAGLFAGADPVVHAGEQWTARELLDQGVEQLISGELGESPRVRSRLLLETGRITWRLGDPRAALRIFEAGHKLAHKELGPNDDTTLRCLFMVGTLASEVGDYPRSEKLLREVLALRETSNGPHSREVSDVLNNLGAIHEETGRYLEALPFYERALAIRSTLLGAEAIEVADLHSNLGVVNFRLNRHEEAEKRHRLALAIREARLPAHHPALFNSHRNLADILFDRGKFAEARELLERSLEKARPVLGADHPDLGHLTNSLGNALRALGHFNDAATHYEEAQRIYRKTLGADHAWVAFPLYHLGLNAAAQGRYAEAEVFHRQALAIRQTDPPDPLVALSLADLGAVLRRLGRLDEAEMMLDMALVGLETGSDRLNAWRRDAVAERAHLALDRNDPTTAREFLARAREIAAKEALPELFLIELGAARLALVQGEVAAVNIHIKAAQAALANRPKNHVYFKDLADFEQLAAASSPR